MGSRVPPVGGKHVIHAGNVESLSSHTQLCNVESVGGSGAESVGSVDVTLSALIP